LRMRLAAQPQVQVSKSDRCAYDASATSLAVKFFSRVFQFSNQAVGGWDPDGLRAIACQARRKYPR